MEKTTPGYKTPAFWLGALATLATAAFASGFADSGVVATVVGFIVTSLGAAGYTAWRAFKKADHDAKPAWKTSEFWLTLGSVVVSGLYASGVLADGSIYEKAVALVATLLSALGYSVAKKK
jgi:hypothetical protein